MLTVYERAITDLEGSRLSPHLIQAAVQLVPTISLSMAGQPYCPACESVLCGACGQCHELDLHPGESCATLEDADDPGMGADCAAWFQAHRTVWSILYDDHRKEQGE